MRSPEGRAGGVASHEGHARLLIEPGEIGFPRCNHPVLGVPVLVVQGPGVHEDDAGVLLRLGHLNGCARRDRQRDEVRNYCPSRVGTHPSKRVGSAVGGPGCRRRVRERWKAGSDTSSAVRSGEPHQNDGSDQGAKRWIVQELRRAPARAGRRADEVADAQAVRILRRRMLSVAAAASDSEHGPKTPCTNIERERNLAHLQCCGAVRSHPPPIRSHRGICKLIEWLRVGMSGRDVFRKGAYIKS